MALKVEGVVNGDMHAEEALGGASRLEPLHFVRHCQLSRLWYARCVGGSRPKVLCSPIVLPSSNREGPQKGVLGPLS